MYVKSIQLENVKGFKNLTLDFERPDQSFRGWTVLVGGNASGKSTLLKALALGMLGPDAGRQLLVSPAGWISPGEARAEARLKLHLDKKVDFFKGGGAPPAGEFETGLRWSIDQKDQRDNREPIAPEFRAIVFRNARDGRIKTAERGPWNPNASGWFCAGYGPMRRLSGSSSESMRFSMASGTMSRFVTLFREDAALSESEAWLKLNHSRQLESNSNDLAVLLDGVQELLGDGLLPHGMKVTRITVDHVYVKDGRGIELPLRDVSDGCRSIYATVLDLIHNMAEVYGSVGLFSTDATGRAIVQKPGVVLIDEIEAHLHPKWQLDIPEWLKVHFPEIQFIVSTHSPLVAQAADPNGVFVLPSQDEIQRVARRLDEHEYEKLKLRRAEKTLLGTAFGLKTTRSKWANDRIADWKRLNAKAKSGAHLSPTERANLSDLQAQMRIAFDEPVENLAAELVA
jgi:predicted ATPase